MKVATELAAVSEAQLATASSAAPRTAQRGLPATRESASLQLSGAPAAVLQSSQAAAAVAEQPPPRQRVRVPPSMRPSRVRGLASSMALEEGLRSHWYPAHFASVSLAAF